MRVIAGEYRSRRLKSVPGLTVRPTPDRLREALFNVLTPRLQGVVFIDAYAGSGAVGIEALSRGARHVVLIERNPVAVNVIRENLASLGIVSEATVVRGNALTTLTKYDADIVFIDPPYAQVRDYAASLEILQQMRSPLVIAQHESRLILPEHSGTLEKTRVLKQGDNSLSFYERAANSTPEALGS
jgi:16S rRNA (guanine966-N2)-methyltransferase